MRERWDAIVVGAGTSGLTMARELCAAGMRVACLEAGGRYGRHSYPRTEADISSRLYWGGGVELSKDAGLAILRPRVVGGGSVVNQALMDRFDDDALDSFRAESGVEWWSSAALAPWYERAEAGLCLQTVPEEHRNGNAEVFAGGFTANGYHYTPLRRAQRDCRYDEGNCCIECLGGCRIDSKQSTVVTALPRAEADGLAMMADVEVVRVEERPDRVVIVGQVGAPSAPGAPPRTERWEAERVVLAGGAIGNTRLLLQSGFAATHPSLGEGFYCHPQFMNFGVFDHEVGAHLGPLQSYKSDDPGFRRQGFKLENVFAGPASIAMLLPGSGRDHLDLMKQVTRMGCIEVCIRDQRPGRISLSRKGSIVIDKTLDAADRRRVAAGKIAIRNILTAMGATRIVEGQVGLGLHLMGALRTGVDPRRSVIGPDFRLHGSRRLYAADSSTFPNAPGINPALTIAAVTLRAADEITREAA